MGTIAESHASLMHYIIQETGVSYLTDQSFKVMDLTEKIRRHSSILYDGRWCQYKNTYKKRLR